MGYIPAKFCDSSSKMSWFAHRRFHPPAHPMVIILPYTCWCGQKLTLYQAYSNLTFYYSQTWIVFQFTYEIYCSSVWMFSSCFVSIQPPYLQHIGIQIANFNYAIYYCLLIVVTPANFIDRSDVIVTRVLTPSETILLRHHMQGRLSPPPQRPWSKVPPTLSPPSISEAHRPSVLFLLSYTDDRGGGGSHRDFSGSQT